MATFNIKNMKYIFLSLTLSIFLLSNSQTDQKIYDIVNAISEERLRNDVKTLADFGTRHTLSDTVSKTRGIGAARRWIKSQFKTISKDCNNCLEVFYQKDFE